MSSTFDDGFAMVDRKYFVTFLIFQSVITVNVTNLNITGKGNSSGAFIQCYGRAGAIFMPDYTIHKDVVVHRFGTSEKKHRALGYIVR